MWPRKTTPAPQTPTPPPSTKTTKSTSPTPTYCQTSTTSTADSTSPASATPPTAPSSAPTASPPTRPTPTTTATTPASKYTATDLHGGTTTGVVNITVNPTDDPGTADPDTATVDEDDSIDITDAHLLTNVHDIDGGLHITSVGNATHGTVVRTNGVTTYTPDPDYNGDDASFEYTATDLHGGTTTGVVNITVNPTDDPGTADPITTTIDEDTHADFTDAALLDKVHDIDGGLHITSVGTATNGTVSRNDVTGVITFIPDQDYNGNDAGFEYTATDQFGGTTTGTVNITVDPIDDAPDGVLVDQPLSTWNTGPCSPCDGGRHRTYGSFSLDDDATVTGGRFAVTEDVGSASDDLNISIWDTPGGTLLYETTVTGSQYTKESEFPNDFGTSNYWAVIDLPDWDLGAGDYYVSLYGVNGHTLGWGSDYTSGDDVQVLDRRRPKLLVCRLSALR